MSPYSNSVLTLIALIKRERLHTTYWENKGINKLYAIILSMELNGTSWMSLKVHFQNN